MNWYTCPKNHKIKSNGKVNIGGSRDIYCKQCDHIFSKKDCVRVLPPKKGAYRTKQTDETKRKISVAMVQRAAEFREART